MNKVKESLRMIFHTNLMLPHDVHTGIFAYSLLFSLLWQNVRLKGILLWLTVWRIQSLLVEKAHVGVTHIIGGYDLWFHRGGSGVERSLAGIKLGLYAPQ